MDPYFGQAPLWDVGRDLSIVYTSGMALYLIRYDSLERIDLTIDGRQAITPEAVTADELRRERDRRRLPPDLPAGARETFMAMYHAADSAREKTHPVITRLRVTSDGQIWIRERGRSGTDSVRWNAFATDGRLVGHLMLPTASSITDGLGQRILIVEDDSLGVPSATWYLLSGRSK